MKSKEKEKLIFIRMFPNEDIYKELEVVCRKHKVKTAVVVSGIGQLKNFQLGYFKRKGNYTPQAFKKPYELLCLNGIISKQKNNYEFHLHAVLGAENKKAIGGHLIKGKVEITNEIVLLKSDLKIKRKLESLTGLRGLFFD